ncbi:MAG: UDP-glucose--hexose-1-phosphate uridylyltransferase, partial [Streptococcus sanguinis]|nr:UDP-glucose--hexose-1-phosphate uridylyltransferase [Streptococcus sanguinis]
MSKKLLDVFVSAVIDNSTFEEMDTIYLSNRVMALVGEAVAEEETEAENLIDLK